MGHTIGALLAGVEKLANSMDSKSIARKGLRVRVPPPAHLPDCFNGRLALKLDDQATIDPDEFFDLIEEFCGVSYPER